MGVYLPANIKPSNHAFIQSSDISEISSTSSSYQAADGIIFVEVPLG